MAGACFVACTVTLFIGDGKLDIQKVCVQTRTKTNTDDAAGNNFDFIARILKFRFIFLLCSYTISISVYDTFYKPIMDLSSFIASFKSLFSLPPNSSEDNEQTDDGRLTINNLPADIIRRIIIIEVESNDQMTKVRS